MTTPDTWRDRALFHFCRWGVRPALSVPLPWRVFRAVIHVCRPFLRGPQGVTVSQTRIADVPARIYTPPGARGTLLWLHGGGFVLGSSDGIYAAFAAVMARETGLRVVMPDYRLAPEWPFPCAPDDCLAVARRIAEDGPFVLAGDSAGGTLALVTLADLLAEGLVPQRVILASPAVDLDPNRPVPDAPSEAVLPVAMLRRAVRDYLGASDCHDPRVSPLRGAYAGAPPVLIQCAAGEMLEGDADAMATHLRAAQVAVTVQKESGVPHVWQLFAGRTPKADRAVAAIVDFLR
ncbi:MAG: alpha/beta hydrolase [Jannaschia sp.]